MEKLLYTLGEVIEILKPGYYAVATEGLDNGNILTYDEDNWMVIIHSDHWTYDINLKRGEGEPRRWAIRELNDEVMDLFNTLPYDNRKEFTSQVSEMVKEENLNQLEQYAYEVLKYVQDAKSNKE